MRHNRKGKVLGRTKAPREALMRSLATSFVVYEKIKTTKAKAKFLKPIVEKLITLGKTDTLHNRRKAMEYLYTDGAVKKVFEVLGPRFKERKGGYTRVVKLSPRVNDAAEMAILEVVEK
ncbi:MAG: 50S ribosomal protein L17 [Parcubacteria group bacterium ADurb.Bin326]|nr:MAG: 50S ribosomal protein L17 [Parcubacteria group bacterium ADurb.Bin326]